MIGEQVAETVEDMETQLSALRQRIASLVDQASKGKNDGEEIAGLTREAAALSSRIEAAKADQAQAERTRHREEQEQARADLAKVLPVCLEQRAAFLEHYRAACVALGNYCKSMATATTLTNKTASTAFGVLPADLFALKALRFAEPPLAFLQRLGLADVTIDLGLNWREWNFPIVPMQQK